MGVELPTADEPAVVIHGDALETLRSLPDASFDAVITDPPYPCIKRDYGTWTEAEWVALMDEVVPECRRVLKPTGSAVFVLQPNSEKVGRMRTWLWEFMAKWGREWGIVQDVWWWNVTAMPSGGATERGLLRGSVKGCVWLGPSNCHRDQDAVLWDETEANQRMRTVRRFERKTQSGRRVVNSRMGNAAVSRGGVTPFNILPIPNTRDASSNGASTPLALARWWTRYICPPGGLILDPFGGSGTMALAAMEEGRRAVLIERKAEYVDIARRRIAAAKPEPVTT